MKQCRCFWARLPGLPGGFSEVHARLSKPGRLYFSAALAKKQANVDFASQQLQNSPLCKNMLVQQSSNQISELHHALSSEDLPDRRAQLPVVHELYRDENEHLPVGINSHVRQFTPTLRLDICTNSKVRHLSV